MMSADRILFVTSRPEDWKEFFRTIRKFGYNITLSQGGEEALQKLQTQSFEILISDFHLPDIDGIELCWQARRELEKTLLLVLILPEPNKELELNCLRSGIDLVFFQPIDYREFRIRLDSYLKRWREKAGARVEGALFSGLIREFSLVDLIQWLSSLHRSGTLWLTHEFERAAIVFNHGEAIFARCGTLLGKQAFFRILTWKEGTFHFEKIMYSSEANIKDKTMRLIMEYIGLQDEQSGKKEEGLTSE